MHALEHITLHRELVKEAEQKTATMNPDLLKALLVGGGVAAGAVPAALITHHVDEHAKEQARNRAFGAGLASGVAAPHILRGLFNIAQRTGIAPQQEPLFVGGAA